MNIDVYCVCRNEAQIMPYFLRHYGRFARRIYCFDGMSTDGTREIVRSYQNAEIINMDTGGLFDDAKHIEMKNEAYKKRSSDADFVIMVDVDEFLYHPELLQVLEQYKQAGVTFPKISGYNMVSLLFPKKAAQLYEQVRRGRPASEYYGKRIIFHPAISINYQPGAHVCNPVGPVVENAVPELKMLHYIFLGLGTRLRKRRDVNARQSQGNLHKGYGVEMRRSATYWAIRFFKNWLLARRVV